MTAVPDVTFGTNFAPKILDLVDYRLEQTNPLITVNNFSGSYGGYGRRQTSSSLPRFPGGIATRYVY